MLKKRGLALKTFMFTFTVITVVITISFAILYFVLPGYYLYLKSRTLDKNVNTLETGLNNALSQEQCAELIVKFANANNSEVIAFDTRDMFIPELSSPFLFMNAEDKRNIKINIVYNDQTHGDVEEDEAGSVSQRFLTQRVIGTTGMSDHLADAFNTPAGNKSFIIRRDLSSVLITKKLSSDLLGYITITSTLQPIDEAKSVLISLIPWLVGLNFVIALAAAYVFANRLTKPMLKISEAAAKMTDMTPGVVSGVRTDDELGELSRNLDGMYLSLWENMENLKSERDKAAMLEQSKTDFMRSAGHELKTPIAALNCVIEGMIDNVGPYKNHEKYLLESKEQVGSLSRLVNEILTASRLDDIAVDITPEDIELNEIVGETASMYRSLIEKKHIRLTREEFQFVCRADFHMLRTVLSNLLSNAVKYTEPGGWISISFDEAGGKLSIENQCRPIDAELLPRLTEPFFTLNYSRNKTVSGTGLGLYIVKKNLDALKLPFEIKNTDTGLRVTINFEPEGRSTL